VMVIILEREVVTDSDGEPLCEGEEVQMEALGDVLRERDPVAVLQAVADTLLLRVGLLEPDGEAREESEGDGLGDALAESQWDALGLAVLLVLWEALGVAPMLPLDEAEAEGLCVTLALTSMFVPEGTTEAEAAAELVFDRVGVRVPVPVFALLSEGEEVDDVEMEAQLLALEESELEGLAVALAEKEALREAQLAVRLALPEELGLKDPLLALEADSLGLEEMEACKDGVDTRLPEGLDDWLGLPNVEGESGGDADAEGDGEGDREAEVLLEPLRGALPVTRQLEREEDADTLRLRVSVGLALGLTVPLRERVAQAELLRDRVTLTLPEGLPERDDVGVRVAERHSEGEPDALVLAEAEGEPEDEWDSLADGVKVRTLVSVALGVFEPLPVAVDVTVCSPVLEELRVCVFVGALEALPELVCDCKPVADPEPVAVEEPEPVLEPVDDPEVVAVAHTALPSWME
jgi:hypothetical protein